MPTPTILKLLATEHREVAKIFEELEKTTERSGKKRQELFAQLDKALSAHAEFEEERVYPLLEDKKSSKPIALEAVEEHLQVKRLLAELRDLEPQDEVWTAKMSVLMENVRHHVKEEENDVFTQLKKLASTSELVELGEEYEASKAETSESETTPEQEPGQQSGRRRSRTAIEV